MWRCRLALLRLTAAVPLSRLVIPMAPVAACRSRPGLVRPGLALCALQPARRRNKLVELGLVRARPPVHLARVARSALLVAPALQAGVSTCPPVMARAALAAKSWWHLHRVPQVATSAHPAETLHTCPATSALPRVLPRPGVLATLWLKRVPPRRLHLVASRCV